MAENESLDLGGAYSKRWDPPFESIRQGASCKDAARKVEGALYSGLRQTLQQLSKDYGVSLQDLLTQRHSPQGLRQLIRKTRGHQYVEFFAASAPATPALQQHTRIQEEEENTLLPGPQPLLS